MTRTRLFSCIALLLPLAAAADVVHSSADGALIEHHFEISAPPETAWAALIHPEYWWPADHTWSGAPSNLHLEAHAGGCFCESWGDSSAEHGRIVMARKAELLRIRGALGPLQNMAVTAVLTVALTPVEPGRSKATVTYRISGDPSHKLDALAPVVDKVIGEQFGAFAAYASGVGTRPST